jgi:hypothetical protein
MVKAVIADSAITEESFSRAANMIALLVRFIHVTYGSQADLLV